jgi:hypothetical protein
MQGRVVLQVMVVSPDEMWEKLQEVNKEEGRDFSIVTPAVKEAVMKNVKRRMTPQPLKIRADLEMTCFTYGGVEHIKVCCPVHFSCSSCLELLDKPDPVWVALLPIGSRHMYSV